VVGAWRSGAILLLMLISRLFVCRQRVLVGQWSDWPSSTIVLAAAALLGQREHGCPRCFLPWKTSPFVKFMSWRGLTLGAHKRVILVRRTCPQRIYCRLRTSHWDKSEYKWHLIGFEVAKVCSAAVICPFQIFKLCACVFRPIVCMSAAKTIAGGPVMVKLSINSAVSNRRLNMHQ